MLILTRKKLERIHIGDNIVITLKAIEGSRCKLAIEAPKDTRIWRGELLNPPAVAEGKERGA